MMSGIKRLLVGQPLPSSAEQHQRLPKIIALAVFASDAISSSAYATEEILHVLVPVAGMAALDNLIPLAIVVTALLAIVVSSYRQTIFAYPKGGGSYMVSKENLGETPALVAGSSLLVDYILTVAVSVSAGVAAIVSAIPETADFRIPMCLGFVLLLTVVNLRGMKESGTLFAVPTYIYVGTLLLMLGIGLFRSFTGSLDPLPVDNEALHEFTGNGALAGVSLFILLRAFSSGAVALSGIEAIADGVPAFRPPESKNAGRTLVWMGVILATLFFGISVLTHRLQPTLNEDKTVLSLLGGAVFGDGTVLFFLLQAGTAAILVLAANTAYADFPRLSSILARDGYLPRQLFNRGDRLVFSNGVIVLAVMASLLIVVFGGVTTALIPLYAVGVFTGFTLSQAGMVRRHQKMRQPGWQRGVLVSGTGAIVTFVVLMVVVVSKFTIGAWVPAVIIPAIVFLLRSIHRHYARINLLLEVPGDWHPRRHTHTVVVLVGRVHKGVLQALTYARSLAPDRLVAVTIAADAAEEEAAHRSWEEHALQVPLEVRYSPYRELTRPVLAYLDELDAQYEDDIITVIVPEFVVSHWWEQLLHNQSALLLKGRLLFRKNTVVTSVPFHV